MLSFRFVSLSLIFILTSLISINLWGDTEPLVSDPYISSSISKEIRPYLISNKHPMKKNLDKIFYATRATTNEQTFADAGFKTFSVRRRSFVHVARHPLLPHYVIKANLDNNLQQKLKQPSWKWFVMRCEGAQKISKVIKDKKFTRFVVAKKWLYALPANPSPPNNSKHTRHLVVLLATDMDLVSKEENLAAWRNKITTEHLDELFYIISHAQGSSYRPDNITYTRHGTFAFIDTEYPTSKPDYNSIRKYLSPKMLDYWNDLVKHGGRKT